MGGPPGDARRMGGAVRWLAAARAGSTEALEQLLHECGDYVLLTARQELGCDPQAADRVSALVEEVVREARREFLHFRGDTAPELLAWLRRLLLDNLAGLTRRYNETDTSRQDGTGEADTGLTVTRSSPTERASSAEQANSVRRAIDRLPDDSRRVLLLRYEEGRSFDEMGRLMGRPVEEVRGLWFQSLRLLQQELRRTP